MTEPRRSSTVRRRRLSAELKRRREAAGLTAEDAAEELGWSRSKVTYIETNRWTRPTTDDVSALLELYKADADEQKALLGLVRDARKRGWWTKYSDVLGAGTYVGLETEAASLRSYNALLVPGLLQTPPYAEAVIIASGVSEPSEVERRLAARAARQELLQGEDNPEIFAVIDEAALSKPVGTPAAMQQQVSHLLNVSHMPDVEIRVLPNSAGAHRAMTGQFVIMNFSTDGDMPVIFIENAHSGLFLEETEDISAYTLIYQDVLSRSLGLDESRERMHKLSEQLGS